MNKDNVFSSQLVFLILPWIFQVQANRRDDGNLDINRIEGQTASIVPSIQILKQVK
jgi:hypothetical protein